ncbi:O-acetylhomoserine aminocarboxypropyltransferase/cysteine synthase family protein [Liquorilactobacillus uvarum]|uniref:O-acetylhomoserine aminocarboxypropyltransferase/cysteine synthase family protein n=1 Tax=Liquorilactobacillus uvarum TaxID=303240 RepID=UPI00288BB18C|nr:aminotransferase class I/II-fold pyridoxal phosphate-dependent enzyme [Liquorilactobacillus uvarum]
MSNNFDTKKIHSGYQPQKHNYSATVPIYQNVAFDLHDTERADKIARGEEPDAFMYSRVNNPTVDVFEKRIAELDGGVGAVAVSSGMAAITYAILNTAEGGGRIIAPLDIYGAALDEFRTLLPKFGINFDFVDDINDFENIERLIKPDTKAIYAESVSNPITNVADVTKIAELAHSHNIPLIIDNTFPTPYLFNPIKHGADIVVYSSTKGISGHGNVVSGLIVDGGQFDWKKEKFPQFYENEITLKKKGRKDFSFAAVYGKEAYLQHLRTKYLRLMGGVLSPFSAYLDLLGLETISERIGKEVATSLKIAHFLEKNEHVERVFNSGLLNTPQEELVKKYFTKGIGTIFSFKLKGNMKNVTELLNNVKVFTYLPNVGDNRSLIVNPSRVTHREIPENERQKQEISDNLIRLSIGLEDSSDLITDLEQAINKAFEE